MAMGGKPRAPRGARHQALRVDVEGGRLIISIGVETLAFGVEHAPGPPLSVYDDDACAFINAKVIDPDVFAGEVLQALVNEAEDGSSMVTGLLDGAAVKAWEDGAMGVRGPGEDLS
jgi:hypothetical protein